MRFEGSCHCRNITFTLDWGGTPARIPARACDCTFCAKHGGVWTSSPSGTLDVHIAEPGLRSEYRFGTGTAVFHLCTRCGVVPLVTSEIEGQTYAVVSVNALEGVAPEMLDRAPASFGEEDVRTRLARRQRGWIPNVRFGAKAAGVPAAPGRP